MEVALVYYEKRKKVGEGKKWKTFGNTKGQTRHGGGMTRGKPRNSERRPNRAPLKKTNSGPWKRGWPEEKFLKRRLKGKILPEGHLPTSQLKTAQDKDHLGDFLKKHQPEC